jgi:hypothetical protein
LAKPIRGLRVKSVTKNKVKGSAELAPGSDAAMGGFGAPLLPLEQAMVLQSLAGDAPCADLEPWLLT